MHFIYMLVIAVAVLTIMAALALFLGSSKSEKTHSLWFLAAAVFEVVWGVSIAVFLSLGGSEVDYAIAPWLIKGIYIGAMLMDSAILGYVAWKYNWGKILTVFYLIVGIIMSAILVYDPSVLYSKIVLGEGTPSIQIDIISGFYIAYAVYFVTLIPAFCLSLFYRIRHTSNKKTKKGYIFFLVGLAIAGFLSGVFDLILPPFRYDLIWVGPLAIGLIILGFYFAILKFKMVSMNATWLKVLSSIVILSSAFIAYLLIFHLVFSALFKVANPSFQVILLNFIMVAIVLALVPAFSEIISLTKSLIMVKQINLPYVVKKLSQENPKKINYKEISSFLAEHMHFDFVGFLIKGKFYAADDYKIGSELLANISKLPAPLHGAWQNINTLNKSMLKDAGITRVAIMSGANGEVVGQMIFGKPISKATLEHKELVEIAMIVSLMGTIIEDGGRSKS